MFRIWVFCIWTNYSFNISNFLFYFLLGNIHFFLNLLCMGFNNKLNSINKRRVFCQIKCCRNIVSQVVTFRGLNSFYTLTRLLSLRFRFNFPLSKRYFLLSWDLLQFRLGVGSMDIYCMGFKILFLHDLSTNFTSHRAGASLTHG